MKAKSLRSRAHPALRVGEHAALVATIDDLAADFLASRVRHDAPFICAELERVVEGEAEDGCGRQSERTAESANRYIVAIEVSGLCLYYELEDTKEHKQVWLWA
jgi:hypothetical protein